MYDRALDWQGSRGGCLSPVATEKLGDTGSVDQRGSEEINPGAVTDAEASKTTALRVTQG